MVKYEVFGIFLKTASTIFLIFRQNVKLNSVFQPAKIASEKKSFVQKLFQVKDAPGSLLDDRLLHILYLAQKLLNLAETFRK